MPRNTISKTLEDALVHRQRFADFSKLELATGGPDHHMVAVCSMSEDADEMEKAWRVGCYIGPYNEPTAIAIWTAWPWERFKQHGEFFPDWVIENWAGLSIRQERRPVKSKVKFAEYFASFAKYIEHDLPRVADLSFNEAWASMDNVRFVGRYASMKMLETFARLGLIQNRQPDIRPEGAWSPRLSLSYLFPMYNSLLNHETGKDGDRWVMSWWKDAWDELEATYSIGIPDPYFFEVLLCDYKQAVDGKYYPGRPLDSALTHLSKVRAHFGDVADQLLDVRSGLFDKRLLGEQNGWWGRRDDLGKTMEQHGYWWNDLEYDFMATEDLANPVRRT